MAIVLIAVKVGYTLSIQNLIGIIQIQITQFGFQIIPMSLVETQKRDLAKQFDMIVDQFKKNSTNGSIELHFSQGVLAKIHERKVY